MEAKTGALQLEEVTVRTKLAKFIGPRERTEFLALLLSLGELVEVTEPFPDAGDPGDDFLLAMLRDGEADLLVSGDKRVLELAEFEGAAIRSMREFADSLST